MGTLFLVSPTKKPKAQVKNDWLKVRATDDQLERWREAAEVARQENEELDFSAWVRTILNSASRALLDGEKRGKATR